MKKSKIIVPALAMIAFSAAASIAGSVAWFTASRQATVDAGTYTVVKTNASLGFTISGGVGTVAEEATTAKPVPDHIYVKSSLSATNMNKLTDASFDHANKKFYIPDSNGEKIGAIYNLSDSTIATELVRGTADDGTNIYSAVTFDIEFTVSFGSINKNVGLYLDTRSGKSSFSVSGGGAAITATGFRMAFVPNATSTNGVAKVYAGLQDDSLCGYAGSGAVNDTLPIIDPVTASNTTATLYTGTTLIDSSYESVFPLTDGTTLAQATTGRNDYLGTFVYSAGNQVKLGYTVVAWFEGTDQNIVNQDAQAKYQSVLSKLCFETVDLPSA